MCCLIVLAKTNSFKMNVRIYSIDIDLQRRLNIGENYLVTGKNFLLDFNTLTGRDQAIQLLLETFNGIKNGMFNSLKNALIE